MSRLAQPPPCRFKVAVLVGIVTRQTQVASTATLATTTALTGMGGQRSVARRPQASDLLGQDTRSARLTWRSLPLTDGRASSRWWG